MTLVSWAKKELAKLKVQSSKRLLPAAPQTTFKTSVNYPNVPSQVSELAADLRCVKCQEKVAALVSTINDLESIVVHVVEKKVTLTRKPINH
ncbi:hypothetical protein C2S51_035631 [Perilla frutescens var. frutescens]|nr:hypothetical protein C2S51_035631 [Perilla frutescens var. frutescens]